jgi:hypothetical protein
LKSLRVEEFGFEEVESGCFVAGRPALLADPGDEWAVLEVVRRTPLEKV